MRFLIVEDHPLVARGVVALTPRDVECVTCASRTHAEEELAKDPRFAGALLDIELPEGPEAGLELAEALEERRFEGVLAVFTGNELADESKRRVSRIGGFFLPKPFDRESFASFFRCMRLAAAHQLAVDEAVVHVLEELPLTARERQLVASVTQGRDASTSANAMGVSASTWDTHARSVLRKTGKKRVHQVAIDVLRKAFEQRRRKT